MRSQRDPSPRLVTHGCGRSWRQRGNRTSHCGGCHQTFEGLSLFDAHLEHGADGTLTHLDPAEMKYRGLPLVLDARYGDGSWHRTDAAGAAFEARMGRGWPTTPSGSGEVPGSQMRGACGQVPGVRDGANAARCEGDGSSGAEPASALHRPGGDRHVA